MCAILAGHFVKAAQKNHCPDFERRAEPSACSAADEAISCTYTFSDHACMNADQNEAAWARNGAVTAHLERREFDEF